MVNQVRALFAMKFPTANAAEFDVVDPESSMGGRISSVAVSKHQKVDP